MRVEGVESYCFYKIISADGSVATSPWNREKPPQKLK